jgi:hypothetical protein
MAEPDFDFSAPGSPFTGDGWGSSLEITPNDLTERELRVAALESASRVHADHGMGMAFSCNTVIATANQFLDWLKETSDE